MNERLTVRDIGTALAWAIIAAAVVIVIIDIEIIIMIWSIII